MSPTFLEFFIAILVLWLAWKLGIILYAKIVHTYRKKSAPPAKQLPYQEKNSPHGQ